MNTSSMLPDAILKAFEPPASGFVGIVDSLLDLCRGREMELTWRSDACRIRIRQGIAEETIDVPLRLSVFRAILARIAAMCNQHKPGSVSPYGGGGEIHREPEPTGVFSVEFVNTAADQRLQLAHRSPKSLNAADQLAWLLKISSSTDCE